MNRRRFTSFLLALLGGGLCCPLLLFLALENFAMPDRSRLWRSYHEIILDHVPGPRVLIDSGSNSLHSIRIDLIEHALNRPVFIVSDNASIPLNLRVKRLEKYSKQGDVILLPLEWGYYGWQVIPSDFLSLLRNRWSEYYFAMSKLERFDFFANHISLDFILSETWTHFRRRGKRELELTFNNVIEEKSNWAGVTDHSVENRSRHISTINKTCREFLSVPHEIKDFVYDFADKLVDLERRRGVKFIMTWPAVAGSDCYSDPEFKQYTEKLRQVFQSRGIQFAGNPEDASFSEAHTLDTYYHIDIDAATQRSGRLAAALKALGLAESQLDTSSDILADAALAREGAKVLAAQSKLTTSRIADGNYRVGSEEFDKRLLLISGWSRPEAWGVWNSEAASKLILVPQPNLDCKLTFDANYFADGPASDVLLNGKSAGGNTKGEIIIPRGEVPVTLTLLHRQLKSPRELGLGDDPRLLSFGLKSVHVECGS